MSTLFVNTIYPDSGSSVNISGSLIISQSLIVADNITMSGSIKLGDADTDSVSLTAEISSSIIPDADLTYNLGSSAKKWNKLHVGNITASHNISSSGIVYGAVGQFDELTLPPFTTITASGGISAASFVGDGSQLTGVGSTGSVLDVVSVSVDTFVSGAGTGSFNHFFVSGEISGSVSASGTGSFQGGVNAAGTNSTFGNITASGNISASGYVFSNNLVLPVDEGGAEEARIVFSKNWTGNVSNQKGDNGYIFDDDQSIQIGYADSDYVAIGHQDPTNTDSDGMRIYLQTGVRVKGSVSASGTGSFQHGIDAAGATGSFGMISASGDISASGTGSFEFLTVPGEVSGNISASGTGSFAGGIDCIGDGTGMSPASGAFGYISTSADIFVGGKLSGSGEVTTNTFSTTRNGIITTFINTDGVISASGDIALNTGSFFRGDGRLLTNITTSVAPPGADKQVVFNDNGSLGAEAGITYATGSLTLTAALIATTHVSTSRVSASAGFESDTASTSSFGYISCSGDFSSSGLGFFANGIETDVTATGSFGYISCSGNISLSGEINGANGTFTTTVSASLLKGQSVQAQAGNNLGYRFNLNNDSQINGIQYNTIGERAHLQIPSLPVSVTLPFSASSTALIGGNLTVGGTTTIAGATTHNGVLNAANGFQVGGVAVTATAAELNVMDGFGGTTTQLNALIKSAAGEIEASKAVEYDSDGAVKTKVPKKTTTTTLSVGDSGTTLMPTADSAQVFTLPNPNVSSGVFFNFIAGSAQTHRISCPTNKIQGFILDVSRGAEEGSNDASIGVTVVTNQATITLVNPVVGDNLQFVSDGDNWYVRGYVNNTPTLTTV